MKKFGPKNGRSLEDSISTIIKEFQNCGFFNEEDVEKLKMRFYYMFETQFPDFKESQKIILNEENSGDGFKNIINSLGNNLASSYSEESDFKYRFSHIIFLLLMDKLENGNVEGNIGEEFRRIKYYEK